VAVAVSEEVPYAESGALEVIRDYVIRVEGESELINPNDWGSRSMFGKKEISVLGCTHDY